MKQVFGFTFALTPQWDNREVTAFSCINYFRNSFVCSATPVELLPERGHITGIFFKCCYGWVWLHGSVVHNNYFLGRRYISPENKISNYKLKYPEVQEVQEVSDTNTSQQTIFTGELQKGNSNHKREYISV